jgi:fructose-1-phosphate kinase PfkB-like protein
LVSAGGKGLNAARALDRLGLAAETYGIIAGRVGQAVARLADDEGLTLHSVAVSGESPIACVLVHEAGTSSLVANGRGPDVSATEWDRYVATVRSALSAGDVFALVCTGPIPRGLPADSYNVMLEAGRAAGACTFIDAEGDVLAAGLRARPDVAKVNHLEATGLSGTEVSSDDVSDEVIRQCLDALEREGARSAVVTLGPNGVVGSTGRERKRARATRTSIVNTTGAGDAFLGGLVAASLRGEDAWDAVCAGLATASASTETLQPGDFLPRRVMEIREGCTLTALGRGSGAAGTGALE